MDLNPADRALAASFAGELEPQREYRCTAVVDGRPVTFHQHAAHSCDVAAMAMKAGMRCASVKPVDQPEVEFFVDGNGPYTLAEMLDANESDDDLCAWLWTAKAFDRFNALQPVECRPALDPVLEAAAVKADLAYNAAKNSGALERQRCDRALALQIDRNPGQWT